MTKNIKSISLWEDNPQKDRISKVVKIEFNFPCSWTILSIEELLTIIRLWIEGEELKYSVNEDIGEHREHLRGRWLLYKAINSVFFEEKKNNSQEAK